MHRVTRAAAVAGSFYPGSAGALQRLVDEQLAAARPASDLAAPKMLLVPHAGLVYSGPVAAQAYALLARWSGRIRRVVLLGPAHRVAVRGLAAPLSTAFATPLGEVPVDQDALARLADLPQVVASEHAHAQEHSLEVQLPFLQTVLAPGFTVVPLVVGRASDEQVAQVLERLWGGDETLILISSDLSHYHGYAQAQAIDRATVERILQLDMALDHDQACGATPLRGALQVARRHALQAGLLDLRNSGDTAGDRSRVVGYAAVAFSPAGAPAHRGSELGDEAAPGEGATLGAALLARARNAIARVLARPRIAQPGHPALGEPAATFVTLRHRGRLRGCIGTLEAKRALGADVRHHALAAAFRDRRFAPLSAPDWPGLEIEVSMLTPPQPLAIAASEELVLAQFVPGEDGIVFEWRGRKATFLPQVWAQLPDAREFLAELKVKAGLAAGFWAPDVALARYRVRKFVAPSIEAA